MTIPTHDSDVPYLTTEQMIEVDRAMIEDYGIELIQMMENAGRHLAHLARVRFLDGDPGGKTVVVLAGTGGNGGGAMTCARRLFTWGARVSVALAKEDEAFAGVPAHQLAILRRMGVTVKYGIDLEAAEHGAALIVDGLIGYSLVGPPHGLTAEMIGWANASAAAILALDVPSGLDATSGAALEPTIGASATLTLALPKRGLRAPGAENYVGELYLADISVPPSLYARPPLELRVPEIFARGDIVRLL